MTAGLTILTYHSLDDSGSVISTDPAWFRETMRRLIASGWRSVDLGSWIAEGRPTLYKGFSLAFDDGLATISEGLDILNRLAISATIFLVTSRIGLENDWPGQPTHIPKRRLLGAEEILELRAAGMKFGAHSRTHVRLDLLDDASLEREVLGSKVEVEDLVGASCPLIAYPYGVSSRRVRKLARLHFSGALGTNPGPAGSLDPIDDLPRIDSYDIRTPERLNALISGRLSSELRLRWAARRFKLAAKTLT